jgi:hypothetical protein
MFDNTTHKNGRLGVKRAFGRERKRSTHAPSPYGSSIPFLRFLRSVGNKFQGAEKREARDKNTRPNTGNFSWF